MRLVTRIITFKPKGASRSFSIYYLIKETAVTLMYTNTDYSYGEELHSNRIRSSSQGNDHSNTAKTIELAFKLRLTARNIPTKDKESLTRQYDIKRGI